MKYSKFIIYFLINLLSFSACANEVLATLSGGENITKADLEKYVSSRIDLGGTFKNSYSIENSLNAMIMTRVLVMEGMARSMPRLEKNASDEKYDDKYGFAVFRSMSVPCFPLKDKEAEKKYYEDNPEIFRANSSVRLYRYMLPASQQIDAVDANTKLTEWAKTWSAKKITLDQIGVEAARHYNLENQGDIGWIQLSDEIELMRAVDSAKVGELVGPVTEGDFVYLFYVADKHPRRQLRWNEVEGDISKMAVSSCIRKNSEDIKNQLYKKYSVVVHKENIKKLSSEIQSGR